MPETVTKMTSPLPEPESDQTSHPEPSRRSSFSTASSLIPETGVRRPESPDLPWLRINWEIKALVPIACVLLGGMLLFLLATLSWRDPERHLVLLVAAAGAVAICGALLVVLTYTVQRPMVELQQKIAELGTNDLTVSVSFAQRN